MTVSEFRLSSSTPIPDDTLPEVIPNPTEVLHHFGLDQLLYGALCLYFLARYLIPWSPRRRWLGYFHYVHLLYFCMVCLSVAELVWFIGAALEVFRSQPKTGLPLFCVLVFTPIALAATLVQGWMQSRSHIDEITSGTAVMKHDRALQIISLPPIYSVMAMCALVELFHQVTHELGEEQLGVAYARYETCILVADLYEAWALYQLGRLTFDVLHTTLGTDGRARAQPGARLRNESSRDVLLTFTAVSSLAWLGTWLFVIICVLQAGYSVFLWIIHDPSKDWGQYEAAMQKFSYAGLVAAGGAVYNVRTIGEVLGEPLQNFAPRLKFLVAMVIITAAFWQLKLLLVLRTFRELFLSSFKVQDWEVSATIQVKILHAALLIFECLLCATVNKGAWDHTEEWYRDEVKDSNNRAEEGSHPQRAGERRPLLSGTGKGRRM